MAWLQKMHLLFRTVEWVHDRSGSEEQGSTPAKPPQLLLITNCLPNTLEFVTVCPHFVCFDCLFEEGFENLQERILKDSKNKDWEALEWMPVARNCFYWVSIGKNYQEKESFVEFQRDFIETKLRGSDCVIKKSFPEWSGN